MFEISQLKAKTLDELKEIAKTIGAKKYSQLKKLDLVYLILDIQASTPSKVLKNDVNANEDKPKAKPRRKRIIKKPAATNTEDKVEKNVVAERKEEPKRPNPKASNKGVPSQKKDTQLKLDVKAPDTKKEVKKEEPKQQKKQPEQGQDQGQKQKNQPDQGQKQKSNQNQNQGQGQGQGQP